MEASISKAIQVEFYEVTSKDNPDFQATIHYSGGTFYKVDTHFSKTETSEHWFFMARIAEFIKTIDDIKKEQKSEFVSSDPITFQHVNGPEAYACIEDIRDIFKHHRKLDRFEIQESQIFEKLESEVHSILEELPREY